MNSIIASAVVAAVLVTTGCDQLQPTTGQVVSSSQANETIAPEDAIAKVNNRLIGKDSLEKLKLELAQRAPGQNFPEDQLVEELVQRELLVQTALNANLQNQAETKERIDSARRTILSQAAMMHYLETNPISDDELKAAYEKNQPTGEEYKARHILLKTEQDAKKIIAQLNKGADFAELAKTKSTGPSGPKGGDLGWFNAQQMVAPFSEAVVAMADGEYSKQPVKTQFGWHVILRESARPITAPPLEQVKARLLPQLQREKIQAYLAQLRESAQVEVLLKPEAKPEATSEAPGSESLAADQVAQPADDTSANAQ
ncbi:MAG: peptidylprolyl isomerase [Methylococcales bacterium]|nr:peptidylprolyl isomerase [Methylococcales bacterium]